MTQWNRYAQAVLDHVATCPDNLLVTAVAGSGKTTLLDAAVRSATHREIRGVCAFSKPIATELEARSGGAYHTGTTHSFGYQWLREVFRCEYSAAKDREVATAVCLDAGFRERDGAYGSGALADLVGFAKNTLAELTVGALERLRVEREVELEDAAFNTALPRLALEALERAARDTRRVSYDDMIWFPARYALQRPTFDLLAVDEVQDLNRAQLYMTRALLRPGGQVIGVGDYNQALFAFRGADARAMDCFAELHSATQLPLSVSYRCSRAVARFAQELVPEFEALDTAPEGGVHYDLLEDDLLREVRPGDFVLSRTNAPILGLASKILARGHRVEVLRRDLGAALDRIISNSKAETVADLCRYMDKRTAQTKTDRTESEARHQAEAIRTLAKDATDIEDLKLRLSETFTESVGSREKVTVATVHAAKGLERDRVWLLGDTLQLWRGAQEEYNIYYVAGTRARNELCIVGDPHAQKSRRR